MAVAPPTLLGMGETPNLKSRADDELLLRLSDLVGQSRRVEADVVAHIGEVDTRRLFARAACSSMFDYCRQVLHLSEQEAYLRIFVARAWRQHPMLLAMLRDGRLHLSGIARLTPFLTRDNREVLLKRAIHKSKRQIEEMVAELKPRPDAPAAIRKLPDRRPAAQPTPNLQLCPGRVSTASSELRPEGAQVPSGPSSTQPAVVEALAPGRHRVSFTASTELRDKLERLKALMHSSVPDGDLAKVIDAAVTEKLERIEARRFGKTKTPRKELTDTDTTPKSRYIPAAVRRVVHERDGGRCTYRDKHGKRCSKRDDLEFHHKKPFGRGGPHSPKVVTLQCTVHNALMAEQDYGREVMAGFRRSTGRVSEQGSAYGSLFLANRRHAGGQSPGTER